MGRRDWAASACDGASRPWADASTGRPRHRAPACRPGPTRAEDAPRNRGNTQCDRPLTSPPFSLPPPVGLSLRERPVREGPVEPTPHLADQALEILPVTERDEVGVGDSVGGIGPAGGDGLAE